MSESWSFGFSHRWVLLRVVPCRGGLDSRRFSPNTRAPRGHGWKVLRHVLRACWAFQQGLEAFCCVCLEVAPKSLGLLCPQLHGRYQLLCGDCLEPYVCSLIGTAELRRHEGGVVCPACACNCEEPTIFSRQQVQARLAGAALRRFVEATEEVEVAPEDPEEDEEWSVLVEDLNTRSVRLATHSRVSEDDEPKVLRRTKDVLPFTWLLCEGDSTYIQYEPDRMKLRQHMSPRLFHLQVAECLTMHCPRCHCPLDPDPDGCVAMTCLACNEGFCWVCFTACGDDAHEHAMDAHGSYFPGQDFVQAWHRKLRWQRVQQILQQLREDSQDESLKGCQALLADVDLWRFPREAPEVPEAVPGDVEEHAGPWGPVGLHLAARLGRLDAVGEALQREDVNLQDNRGMTPLCYACHEGRMEVIRLLMERQADPNVADLHGVTPLHYACREPPFPILEDVAGLLLSYPQVDANQRDESGASAILVAAEVGRHQVMPSLLRCERLDPNLTNHAGRTALLVAASFDHTQVVVELLRSERVKVDLRGQDGETPLLLAAKRGSLELVQLLLSHPDTEPHAVNRTGRTALMEAANLGASEVVRCLLASGEVDRQDSSGCTALMLAAHSGSVETFEQLLPLSPNLQQRDVQGFTVLMRLAERGSQKGLTAHACLELLLSSVPRSRVEINAQNVDGSTALMLAVRNGCVPSVETLLDHGAGSGTSLHDLRGETAWTLASLCRPETFRALRHILPREEATTFMLLYDGLLFHSVERANRTLLAGGDLQLWNSTLLTVEFECREFRKWKEAGYQIFPREIFFQQHEECTHELEIQRVNGQSFANQELRETDSIKVRNCKHVRRLESWRKEGWTLSEDGRKLCHWGARKMVNLVVVEESCTETWEAVEEFLDIFA